MSRRLFFALPLPDAARAQALRAQEAARHLRASFPAAEGLHVTLAFLGDRDGDEVPRLLEAAAAAARGVAPFPLETRGLGGFPRLSAPRVLWMGLAEQPALADLARRLALELATAGAPPDPAPFRPHITLARLRVPADLRDLPFPGPPEAWTADAFHLYESVQAERGSRYLSLGAVPLEG
ncbi:MAG TPA: RNA 2',3'-cyclic phosphodiesterase [Holophaga sp.]|nr:RNA 2',3'-cyclic phosphodiesterase [Holophaga sp.]